ncbi:MAG: hypothetical protein ACRED1_06415 [Limisphaerales bacterium]
MRFIHYLICVLTALVVAPSLRAQVSPHVSSEQAVRLQVAQPAVDVSSPVTVTAGFDPPVARVGQSVFYRVALDGGGGDIQWPNSIHAPHQLIFGPLSQDQLVHTFANTWRLLHSYLYEARATAVGHFTVPGFQVRIDGKPVQIPAATLDVDKSVAGPAPRRLVLDLSSTNVFLGQPVRARVMLPASPENQIEALREVQFGGKGFISDLTTMRQAVQMVGLDGRAVPAFVYEITLTPIEAGPLAISAQGFAAGREFFGPITISGRVSIPAGPPRYVLLASNPVQVNVHPLPAAGQPADFNGSIGTFSLGLPQLSTNRIHVGQPVRLTVAVHTSGALNRLAPPRAPTVNDWEIVPDNPPDFSFTLIPLTDTTRQTPAIPFSAFDPAKGRYVNLTIPSVPVTFTPEGLPTELPSEDSAFASASSLRLGGLLPSDGKSLASLAPPQRRSGLIALEMVPLLAILALWQWDRRRRFLEANPDIVRRREARRLLRREKRRLRAAARRGDAAAIVRHAAGAMKIASAPRYATHPQALVCSDVLNCLDDADRGGAVGKTVREIFAAADARFASRPPMEANWSALESDVSAVFLKLEEQL